MSEFTDMIREALLDSEKAFEPSPNREDLQRSVEQYGRRMKTVRWMTLMMLTFMGGVAIWSAVSFAKAPDDAPMRDLLLYSTGFAFSMLTIGWGKLWFQLMQNHLLVVKEIKRTQFMVLDSSR